MQSSFESFLPAFDLAVALGVVRRGFHMGHTADADEFLEVLGDELRATVRDHPRPGVGISFAGALDDGLHIDFLQLFSDLPVDNEAAAAIEDAAEEVKGPCDVDCTFRD